MKLFPVRVIMTCALLVTGSAPVTLCASPVVAAAFEDGNSPVTVAGNWKLTFTDAQGNSHDGALQIEQSGASLSGNFQGPRGNLPITGSVQGKHVTMTVKAMGHELTFSGETDGRQMSGTTSKGKAWGATRD